MVPLMCSGPVYPAQSPAPLCLGIMYTVLVTCGPQFPCLFCPLCGPAWDRQQQRRWTLSAWQPPSTWRWSLAFQPAGFGQDGQHRPWGRPCAGRSLPSPCPRSEFLGKVTGSQHVRVCGGSTSQVYLCVCGHVSESPCMSVCPRPHRGQQLRGLDRAEEGPARRETPSWGSRVGPHFLHPTPWAC